MPATPKPRSAPAPRKTPPPEPPREIIDGHGAGNALRQLAELPWFVRNLVVKVALATGFTPLARLVGYRSDEWPY